MRLVSVVTGGAGFIGSHIVDALVARGHEVRILDDLSGGHKVNIERHLENDRVTLVHGDIRGLEANDAVFKGVDYVFHLA